MKKGLLEQSFIIIAIILIVSLSVFIFILNKLDITLNNSYDREACAASIAVQAATKPELPGTDNQLFEANSPFRINCPRRTLTVTNNEVTGEYRGTRFPKQAVPVYVKNQEGKLVSTQKYDNLNAEVLYSAVAESMRQCWAVGREGKIRVFNDRTAFLKKNVCLICDEIIITTPPQPTTASFENYLKSTYMPNRQPPISYDSYLFTPTQLPGGDAGETLSGGEQCLQDYNINKNLVFDQGSYAVVFFRAFSHTQTGCINTYVVPVEELWGLCDYVAN
jgi:hypothetical protein